MGLLLGVLSLWIGACDVAPGGEMSDPGADSLSLTPAEEGTVLTGLPDSGPLQARTVRPPAMRESGATATLSPPSPAEARYACTVSRYVPG
jgi:hypothetical protein